MTTRTDSIYSLFQKILTLGKHWEISSEKMNFQLIDGAIHHYYKSTLNEANNEEYRLVISPSHDSSDIENNSFIIEYSTVKCYKLYFVRSDTELVKLLTMFHDEFEYGHDSCALAKRCVYEKRR